MPKAPAKRKTKSVAPVAPEPQPTEVVAAPAPASLNGLPVLYPELDIREYSTAHKRGPLTVDDIVLALGWEDEKEYQARRVRENPGSKPEHFIFGDEYHCRNVAGTKVRCHNNAGNRPFDQDWCDKLIHTHLYGQWAGPHTIPGETVNGETVRISRYGRVLSGQHQMTATKLADERLAADRQAGLDHPDAPKYPAWRNQPHVFLETVVIRGVSEDTRVLQTIDYVKPRTAADVFYTSDVFKDSTAVERKELCRMLAGAVDVLWDRTDARGYKTHPEVVAFLDRHLSLLKCVLHLYAENSAAANRRISRLRLQPGQCSALMYLMGHGAVTAEDSDVYRNEAPPTEKGLDRSCWDRAEEFWTLLAGGADFLQVRTALGRLVDSAPDRGDNAGLGGRAGEKLAILAKAWDVWRVHPAGSSLPPFTAADLADGGALSLSYTDLDDKGVKLPPGQIKLLDVADFGGIDCPGVSAGKVVRGGPPMPPPPTREEIERATEAARARRGQT